MLGLSDMNRELGVSVFEALSGDIYSEEIETDIHSEGDFDKAVDNRVYDKNKGMYVDINPRVNADGTPRISSYNILSRDKDLTEIKK